MNRRTLLSAILVILWGIFSIGQVEAQSSVQSETKEQSKSVTTAKQKATTEEKATPAKPSSTTKRPATVKQGVPASKTKTLDPTNPSAPPSAVPRPTTAKPSATQSGKAVSETKDITGYWLTAQKATIVEFYKVGNKYNGKAVWSKQRDKSGKPLKDVNNPDKTKRNNSIVGTDLITGLTYNPKTGDYEGGKIYQPQTGKSFNCKVKLDKSKNTMQVIGGAGFISRTLTWTRTSGIPGK